MAHSIQAISIASGTLIGVTFLLFMVSNAFIIWSETGDDFNGAIYGLWRYCSTESGTKTCNAVQCSPEKESNASCNKILTARAFLILACIFSCMSGILWVLFCAVRGDTKPWLLILTNKGLAFGCLVTGIIGVALGINATITLSENTPLRLGAAAIIGIIGIAINTIAVILLVLAKH